MSQDAKAPQQAKQEGLGLPPRHGSESSLRVSRSGGSAGAVAGSTELSVQRGSLSFGPAQYSPAMIGGPIHSAQRVVPTGAITINRYPSWPVLPLPAPPPLKAIPVAVGVNGVQAVSGFHQPQQQLWGGCPPLPPQQPSPVLEEKCIRAPLHSPSNRLSKTMLVTTLNVLSFFLLLLHIPLAIWCSNILGRVSVFLFVGPLAAVLSFWSLSLQPCGCASTSDLAIERLRLLNGVVAVLDAVSGLAVPVALFHLECNDDDKRRCKETITSGQFISIAVAVVATAHFILTVTLRVRAASFAQYSQT